MVFPICASLAKAEHIPVFYRVHLVENGMGNVRLQFSGKIGKDPHLDNGHKTSAFKKKALVRDDSERTIKTVQTSIRSHFAARMVSSHDARPPCVVVRSASVLVALAHSAYVFISETQAKSKRKA